ncbi:ABC transporter substrate-binding protein [Propionicicella superfundia]|uniref:ABC transporter substrate-binding protein n=1 Tax=Propionicicella superfundia TaxID=348582 RepID=UPI0003F669DB|nr:ABC transporter substrate-binding protein [Propionicicella superfundia]
MSEDTNQTPSVPESTPPENSAPPGDEAPATGSVDASLAGKERRSRSRWIVLGAVAAVLIVAIVATFLILGNKQQATAVADTDATLTVGLTLEPTNLDIRKTSGAALEQVLIGNVYQGLVSRATDGSIKPALATEWKISDDALTYTFTLAEGVTFSNGDALTAKTAAQSIQSVIDDKLLGSEYLGSVKSVTAADDTTLTIVLTQPYPDLLWALSGRAGLVLDPAATNDAATTAIGSGPFTLESWKQGDSLTLARSASYAGDKPKVAKVVFRYITDTNAALNALKAGDLDVLAPVDGNLVSQLSTDEFTTTRGQASDKFVLAFNNTVSPLSDKRVRQAIRYSIDHEAIIKARGGADTALGGPIPEGDPGYEDLTGLYTRDVAKAKSLLAEAGYADGLTLTLTIPSFYGDVLPNLLTSQLAEAGITLKTTSVEFATWLQDVYTNHDYELSIVDHAESHDFGSWANPDYYFGYDNAEVQKLYAESQVATSTETSSDLLAQAAKIVSEDAAADWLINFRTVTAVRAGVEGFPTDQINNRLDVSTVTVAKAD